MVSRELKQPKDGFLNSHPTNTDTMQFKARIRFMDTSPVYGGTPKRYVHISTHNVRVKRYDYRKNPTENNLSDVSRFSRDIRW